MRTDTLNVLRCPYFGGRLELVTSMFHRADGDRISEGILGCHCCIFPVVDGIPILHLLTEATTARDQVKAGRPDLARRTMFGLSRKPDADQVVAHDGDEPAEQFDTLASSETATYQEIVEALG